MSVNYDNLGQDREGILFFYANDLKFKAELKGFMKAYNFIVIRKWMGFN
jgi:hypothetical protein